MESSSTESLIARLSPTGIVRTGPDGAIVETNAMWHRITGVPDDGPVGQRLIESIHPADRDWVTADWRDIVTLRQAARFDCRVVHPDGKTVWVRVDVAPDRTRSGELRGFVGTVTDIDDLKRAEAKLAASEERLRIALDATELGLWEWAIEGRTGWWSPRAREIMGVTEDRTIGAEEHLAMIHPEDRHIVAGTAERLIRFGESFAVEYRVTPPGQPERWVATRGAATRSPEGRTLRATGTIIDISEAKAAAERIRTSEERMRLAQAAGGVGVFDWNVTTDETYWSPENFRIHGRETAVPPTYPEWQALVHPDDLERMEAVIGEALAGRPRYEVEYRIVRENDHAVRWVSVRSEILRDAGGNPVQVVGGLTDITERRATEAMLAARVDELATLADLTPAAIWVAEDATGTRITGNRYAAELLGIANPTNHSLSAPDAERPAHFCLMREGVEIPPDAMPLQRAARGMKVAEEAWDVVFDDGRIVHMLGTAQTLRDASGAPRGAVMVALDVTQRRIAEDRLNDMLESTTDMVAMVDRDWNYIYQNRRSVVRLGEVVGQNLWDVFEHLVGTPEGDKLLALMDAKEPITLDSFNAKTGRWQEVHCYPSREGLTFFFNDITEAKALQDAIAEGEERLRLATEAAEVGFWDVDVVGDRLIWPARTKAMFGISADVPVTMQDFYDGLHPDDREATSAAYAAAADPSIRALYDVDYRTVGKEDGLVRWLAAKGRGVFDGEGADARCLRVAGTVIDISVRKRAEDALQKSDADFRALAENMPNLCWMAEADGAIYWYNKRWYDYSGLTPADMAAGRWAEAHDPALLENIVARWATATATGEPWEMTIPLRGADGEFRPFLTRAVPLRGRGGELERWFGTNVDISTQVSLTDELRLLNTTLEARVAEAVAARETALAQLHEAQKLETLGQLTGGVAHDFNNLLTPIVGAFDVLKRRHGDEARDVRLIDGGMAAAERARTLVQRLLAFGRRQLLQDKPVDVAGLVHGMMELIRGSTGARIAVETGLPAGLPPARVDPNQLEMALLNVAINARDAMPEGGRLRIEAAAETADASHPSGLVPGDYVRLDIADTGTGMSGDTLRRAVEPFFTTKGVGKGTGLGLSMAHGLAAQSGGALDIVSAPGEGTTIRLWLPVAQAGTPVSDGDAIALAKAAESAAHVLLVDDEELVRLGTADMLSDLGYSVIEASSGEEALQLLDEGVRVDALVTDYLMPGMTGSELIAAARVRRPGLPALVVTGYVDPDGLGIDAAVLAKPFRQEELASRLTALLDPAKIVAFPGRTRA